MVRGVKPNRCIKCDKILCHSNQSHLCSYHYKEDYKENRRKNTNEKSQN